MTGDSTTLGRVAQRSHGLQERGSPLRCLDLDRRGNGHLAEPSRSKRITGRLWHVRVIDHDLYLALNIEDEIVAEK